MLSLLHSAGQMGWVKVCEQMGVNWYVAEGLALLVGVCLIVERIPERFSPGRFDIWGHSHQLFHVCAVMDGWFHLVALVTGYRYRQAFPRCWIKYVQERVEQPNPDGSKFPQLKSIIVQCPKPGPI